MAADLNIFFWPHILNFLHFSTANAEADHSFQPRVAIRILGDFLISQRKGREEKTAWTSFQEGFKQFGKVGGASKTTWRPWQLEDPHCPPYKHLLLHLHLRWDNVIVIRIDCSVAAAVLGYTCTKHDVRDFLIASKNPVLPVARVFPA